MAMKTTFFLLLLGIPGILEVQAASIAGENEIWKNLDEEDDKRNVEVDNIEPSDYLPSDLDDLEYEDLASNVADDFDYYKDAIESRAVACQDVFGALCRRLTSKNPTCSGRGQKFAFRYCRGSCSQFCK